MQKSNVVLDVWGGESSCDHVARSLLPVALALKMAEQELSAGYLVNMRAEVKFGVEENFDTRCGIN